MFTGEWIYKATIVDSDWNNNNTFIGEETNSFTGSAFKLRWEISEGFLTGYKIPQKYRDQRVT